MRYLCVVLAVLLSATSIAGESAKSADEAILRQINQIDLPKAYVEQDAELLATILADEYQSIDSNGHWSNRAKELDYVKNSERWYDNLSYKIMRLDVFENGTAVVSGIGTFRRVEKTGPVSSRYHWTNVFIKRNGLWKVVASHKSDLKTL